LADELATPRCGNEAYSVQNSIKELLNRGERRKSRNSEWCDSARCSVKGCTNLGDLVGADSIRSLRNMSIGSTVYKLRKKKN
jgi:hypothetical protein